MNNLIIYYTKGETTKETVNRLISKLGKENTDVLNIQKKKECDLSKYDRVIFGSGVYGGNIPIEIKQFLQKNIEELNKKQIIIFLHALGSEDKYKAIVNNGYSVLGQKDYMLFYLGGKSDLSKQNFFIKFLMRKLAKSKNLDINNPNNIREEEIERLIEMI